MKIDPVSRFDHRPRSRPVSILALLGVIVLVLTAAPASASPASVQAQQWWITRLGLADTWKISQGAGVTVALLDSGVDPSRADLSGAVVADPGLKGYASSDPDAEKHGTQMASYIAGRGTNPGIKGVAPQAKILPLDLTGTDGTISLTTALTELTAMATPPRIVNMSVASAGSCDEPGLQQAVLAAVNKGMILIAAAGNNGQSGNSPQYPADCVGVISVSAVDNSLNVWSGSNGNSYLDFAAPGESMISFVGSSTTPSQTTGTSNAAAILSGSFADLVAHFPKSSSRDLVTRMLYTARQYEGAQGSRNNDFGYGLARVHHALTDSVPASAPNPIYDEVDKLTKSSGSSSGSTTSSSDGPPGAGTVTVSKGAKSSSGGGSNTGLVIGGVVAALVVIGGAAFALTRRRGHAR